MALSTIFVGGDFQVSVDQTLSELEIDLLSCANFSYEKRGNIHGVSYCDSTNWRGWTPVVDRRKKRTPLPEHVLRRFPPHRWAELQRVSSDSESSDSDEPLHIPESASVEFAVHNSRPGLQVKTRSTTNWTPIASRTRARLKGTSGYCFRVHASTSLLAIHVILCT